MMKLSKRPISAILALIILLSCFAIFPVNADSDKQLDMINKSSMTVYLGKSAYGNFDYKNDDDEYDFVIYSDVGDNYVYEITSVKSSNSDVARVRIDENKDLKIIPVSEGTATITVYAYGSDENDEYADFYDKLRVSVKRIPASKLTVSAIPDQKYTGKNIRPGVTVKYGNKTLKKDTDYKLSYENNRNVGKGSVIVTLIGRYSGTINKKFNILPTINKSSAKLHTASKLTLTVKTSEDITWKSSSEKVATVSQSGVVTAHKKGTATITATTGGKKVTCKITVVERSLNKTELNMYVGHTAKLEYVGGSGKVKWRSSDTKVAKVDSDGNVTATGAGKATITATRNGEKLSCTVKVIKQRLSKKQLTVYVGKTKTLMLKGAYQKVTWKSSNTKIATVDKNGVVRGKKKGEVTVTALHAGKTYTCKVTVKK